MGRRGHGYGWVMGGVRYALPIPASASPNVGTTAGGLSTTITGTGFIGATGATIGGQAVTSFVVVNNTTITCVTPAHAAGATDIIVSNPAMTGTATGAFTYYATPVPVSVSPSSGAPAGSTSITITGTGFTGATSATVGGVAVTSFSVTNSTTITCVTGAHSAGSVDVIVTNPATSGTGTGIYSYAFDPASMALTMWYRAGSTWNATAGTWDGTASAGTSGAKQLTSPGTKPTDGTAVNGLVGPTFVAASSQVLVSGSALSAVITDTASSGWVLAKATVFPSGNADGGGAFIADGSRYWGIYATLPVATASCAAFVWDAGRHQDDQTVTSDVYFLFQYYHDGTKIYTRVNSGSWSAGTTAGSVDVLTDVIKVGLGGVYLTGTILEIGIINTTALATQATSDGVLAATNTRYALSL